MGIIAAGFNFSATPKQMIYHRIQKIENFVVQSEDKESHNSKNIKGLHAKGASSTSSQVPHNDPI
jgi:hypothetical protein